MLETLPKLKHETVSNKAKTTAIIVAAGSASRMNGICKITVPICGMPAIIHTLKAYDKCKDISDIVLVTREDLVEKLEYFCGEFEILKSVEFVVGGATRAQSVLNGAMIAKSNFIAIADGARVLTTPKLISKICTAAYEFNTAIPTVSLVDTIKSMKNGKILKTLNRDELVAVQTPQVVKRETYLNLAEKALGENIEFTDDSAILEHFGETVRTVEGERFNIKITTQYDVKLAEFLLKQRGEMT